MQQDHFVGIYEPLDVRRNLLESSREIIKSLDSYFELEKIRRLKIRTYNEMRQILIELDMLVSKLEKKLPKTQLRKSVKIKTTKKYSNEMEKLEDQLRTLEKDLSTLKI